MNNPFKDKVELNIFINAFHFSIEGFKKTFKNEDDFRKEFYLSLILILVGLIIGETSMQKIFLISSIVLIPITEILNYSLNSVTDRISFNNQHLSKKIKCIGSVAIFLSIGNAFITWILILFF
jgi:diacylglycerol kinase (ATP)|tara:strand:+ start:180 stop:548 length:369 start_codon:yes stop_codon:yes gene_type:complete